MDGSSSSDGFAMSGSSPPARPTADANVNDEMPPQLIEEVGRLLAQALVADIRQYPNLAELKASRTSTVESPPGRNRNRSSRKPPATAA